MDFSDELELLAANANAFDGGHDDSVSHLRMLFDYSQNEAETALERLMNGLDSIVSEDLWDSVREQEESLGHDRLTYSHWLARASAWKTTPRPSEATFDDKEHLVQLGGPFDSPEILATILGCREPPPSFHGESLDGAQATQFCRIDGRAKARLLEYIIQTRSDYSPLIVATSYARKIFCSHCAAPLLGVDTSLPQHRLDIAPPSPAQAQYPVWYFFYGTLCNTEILNAIFRYLDGDTSYEMVPARIRGGKMGTWGAGKYKALTDDLDDPDAVTEGYAFLVESKEHEDALCYYETGSYEVARCKIEMASGIVEGCTFRFVGGLD